MQIKLICGRKIQLDRSSGQGTCWRDVDADELPFAIHLEIESEMLDGRKETCDRYVATNGLVYRW